MKQIVAEHGIPRKSISDNGPQFSAAIFKQFAEQWSFHHITTSPRYPKSNGFIERHVQTVKAALTKAQQAKTDPDLALLCLHTAPISSSLPSPMKILTGRKAMSNIPTKLTSPQPEVNIRQELRQRPLTQKMYHDQHAKDFPHLATGQPVRLQDHQTGEWREATVMEKCEVPRSYLLTTPQGQLRRRNRVHIRDVPRPANTNASPTSNPLQNDSKNPTSGPEQPSTEPAQQQSKQANAPYTTLSGQPSKPPSQTCDSDDRTLQVVE